MDIPEIIAKALETPEGIYHTLKSANIKTSEAVLTRMENTAITNANSLIPVIGTAAFNPCFCAIAYNKKIKTAALLHITHPNNNDIVQLVNAVRSKNKTDLIEMHVMGGPFTKPEEDDMHEGMNGQALQDIEKLLNTLKELPNIRIKTFDVWDKPKPNAILFDTRNGRLVSGTPLFKSTGAADAFMNNNTDEFIEMDSIAQNFDGTTAEMRAARTRH